MPPMRLPGTVESPEKERGELSRSLQHARCAAEGNPPPPAVDPPTLDNLEVKPPPLVEIEVVPPPFVNIEMLPPQDRVELSSCRRGLNMERLPEDVQDVKGVAEKESSLGDAADDASIALCSETTVDEADEESARALALVGVAQPRLVPPRTPPGWKPLEQWSHKDADDSVRGTAFVLLQYRQVQELDLHGHTLEDMLRRPNPKFVYQVAAVVHKATGFPAHGLPAEWPEGQDARKLKLDLFWSLRFGISEILRLTPVEVSPIQILKCMEREKTRWFLQLLAIAAAKDAASRNWLPPAPRSSRASDDDLWMLLRQTLVDSEVVSASLNSTANVDCPVEKPFVSEGVGSRHTSASTTPGSSPIKSKNQDSEPSSVPPSRGSYQRSASCVSGGSADLLT